MKKIILKLIIVLYFLGSMIFSAYGSFLTLAGVAYGIFEDIGISWIIGYSIIIISSILNLYSFFKFIVDKKNRYFYLLILYFMSLLSVTAMTLAIGGRLYYKLIWILFTIVSKIVLIIVYIKYFIDREKAREID